MAPFKEQVQGHWKVTDEFLSERFPGRTASFFRSLNKFAKVVEKENALKHLDDARALRTNTSRPDSGYWAGVSRDEAWQETDIDVAKALSKLFPSHGNVIKAMRGIRELSDGGSSKGGSPNPSSGGDDQTNGGDKSPGTCHQYFGTAGGAAAEASRNRLVDNLDLDDLTLNGGFRLAKEFSPMRIEVIDTLWVTNLHLPLGNSLDLLLEPYVDRIYAPVHIVPRNHWVFFEIFPGKDLIHLYDSVSSATAETLAQTVSPLRNFMNHHQLPWAAYPITRMAIPQQPNSHDCGLYAIMAALHRAAGLGFPEDFSAGVWRFALEALLFPSPSLSFLPAIVPPQITISVKDFLTALDACPNDTNEVRDDARAKQRQYLAQCAPALESLRSCNGHIKFFRLITRQKRDGLSTLKRGIDERRGRLDEMAGWDVQDQAQLAVLQGELDNLQASLVDMLRGSGLNDEAALGEYLESVEGVLSRLLEALDRRVDELGRGVD